jgi:hypothetical protein
VIIQKVVNVSPETLVGVLADLTLFSDGKKNKINRCDVSGEMLGKLDTARGQIYRINGILSKFRRLKPPAILEIAPLGIPIWGISKIAAGFNPPDLIKTRE